MKTSPTRIAAALRFVADGIDNSTVPNKQMVASDIKLIISALDGTPKQRSAEDSDQKLADILWKSEEGRDVEEAYGIARKTPIEDKLVTALNGLKSSVDDFVKHLKDEKTNRQSIREEEMSGGVMTSAPKI